MKQVTLDNKKAAGGERLSFKYIKKRLSFYIMLIPGLLAVFVFSYCTMPGILMAFQDYDFVKGFFGSEWVGFRHIHDIFTMTTYRTAIINTIVLNTVTILISFSLPIIFALLLNEIRDGIAKKSMQTISYLPHFLSWVSIVAITYSLFARDGFINDLRVLLLGQGTERIMFMAQPRNFVPIYIGLYIWQSLGWDSVIYLAAISGVDQQLYEAVKIDGGNRFSQVIHVTLPSILPTIIVLFILKMGTMFADNFDLVFGLQNAYVDFEVISTVVYKSGIKQANYSMATAMGLIQGVFGFILMAAVNVASRKISEVSLW
ncbi:MAG: sugar ABC transporter permease [Clostridia bacterium]|nr:sugar ABC transporter permease [Clostridia bacterium]